MSRFKRRKALAAGQRTPSGHVLFCRCTDKVEDDLNLIEITVAGKDWLFLEHFAKDATVRGVSITDGSILVQNIPNTPHVNGGRIVAQLKE